MKFLATNDLLHPDTVNMLLSLQLFDSSESIILDCTLDVNRHLVMVINEPAMDGYCVAPILRRVEKVENEWRHFPMCNASTGAMLEMETHGAAVKLPDLLTLGTLLARTLWQLDRTLEMGFQQLLTCLRLYAWFPCLHNLTYPIALLDQALYSEDCKSRSVVEVLHTAGTIISCVACSSPMTIPVDASKLVRYPSAKLVKICLSEFYSWLSSIEIEIGPASRIDQGYIDRLDKCFSLDESGFIGRGQGAPLRSVSSWAKQDRVRLVPKALRA